MTTTGPLVSSRCGKRSDLVDADQFVTDLNAEDIVKVWGLEFDAVSYENQTRSFSRSLNARLWCNEAYPAS